MSSQLSPKQALVLWNLLITGEEPMVSKVRPELSPAERRPLEEANLIRLEKRGRAKHIVLEDKAWDWAVNNFDIKLSLSQSAVPILQTLLTKLGHYLNTHQVPLAKFLTIPASDDQLPDVKTNDLSDLSIDDLIQKVHQAYLRIPDGQAGFRVRLHELREHLSEFSDQQINEALLTMQKQGAISLLAAEDLHEIKTADESAAIDMGGDDKRYFAYMDQ